MTRWQGTADLRSAPLRKAQRNGVSPRSRMTEVSARTPPGKDDALARERRLTPAGKDDALARERRPPVGTAARSAAKVVYHAAVRMTLNAEVSAEGEPPPHSGSFLPPACGGLCRPEVGVPLPARRSAWWRGAERRTTPALEVVPCRPPTAGCADQRSAFPCLRVALHGGVEPRGEPPPHSGSFSAARLRRAVPTRGRRSRACASLRPVAWSREANHPRTRSPSLPPAAVRRSSRAPSSGTAPCPVHTKSPARWRVSRGAAIAAPRGVPVDGDRGQVIVSSRR